MEGGNYGLIQYTTPRLRCRNRRRHENLQIGVSSQRFEQQNSKLRQITELLSPISCYCVLSVNYSIPIGKSCYLRFGTEISYQFPTRTAWKTQLMQMIVKLVLNLAVI